jgi:hypothetical protein
MDMAKSQHYVDAINDNISLVNCGKFWLKTPCKVKSCIIGLDIDDVLCYVQAKVKTMLTHFLPHTSLVKKLLTFSGHYGQSFFNNFYHSKGIANDLFELCMVAEDNVSNLHCLMSTNKSAGLDHLPARFIKDSACVTAKMITHIYVITHICKPFYSKDPKTAQVFPFHEKSRSTHAGNYRPVLILSTSSKVVERLVLFNLRDTFLSTNFFMNYNLALEPLIPLILALSTFLTTLSRKVRSGTIQTWSC